MVTALAGLRTGTITRNTVIECTGIFTEYQNTDGFAPVCWIYGLNGGQHGPENVVTALRDSCNFFFYTLGDDLGIRPMEAMAYDFGFGARTGIELPDVAGTVATPEYKKDALEEDDDWYAADNIITAIGQGYSYYTPIQLANYAATIANGGTRHSLTMLSNIRSADFTSVIYQPEIKVLGTVREASIWTSSRRACGRWRPTAGRPRACSRIIPCRWRQRRHGPDLGGERDIKQRRLCLLRAGRRPRDRHLACR
jgi:penicillin-binding protein 2